MAITQERAERIARAHACSGCQEYSYRKVAVKASSEALRDSLRVDWVAAMTCGVCGLVSEVGIDGEGDVVYVG